MHCPLSKAGLTRPSLLDHLCWCNLCHTQAAGDELHCIFDCSHFRAIRAQYSVSLSPDAEGSMHVCSKLVLQRSFPIPYTEFTHFKPSRTSILNSLDFQCHCG